MIRPDYSSDASGDRWPSGWWIIPAFFVGCCILGAVAGWLLGVFL